MHFRVLFLTALFGLIGSLGSAAENGAPPLDPVATSRACEGGAIDACTRLGRACRLGNDGMQQDFPRARRLLERACTLGHGRVPACTDYAAILHEGFGGPKDDPQARGILDRACVAKESSACAFLGLIYTEGLGVPYTRDYQRIGVGFFQKACELGHHQACWHLGLLLRSGVGVKRDPAAARLVFDKACKAGENLSCEELKKPPSVD